MKEGNVAGAAHWHKCVLQLAASASMQAAHDASLCPRMQAKAGRITGAVDGPSNTVCGSCSAVSGSVDSFSGLF